MVVRTTALVLKADLFPPYFRVKQQREDSEMWKNTRSKKTRSPWNKGKLIGQKPPLTQQEIWSIRMRIGASDRSRDLAMFNLAIDSKLRACDLLRLKVADVCDGVEVKTRASILQQKTKRAVQFELTTKTRDSIASWIEARKLGASSYLFPSRIRHSLHLSS